MLLRVPEHPRRAHGAKKALALRKLNANEPKLLFGCLEIYLTLLTLRPSPCRLLYVHARPPDLVVLITFECAADKMAAVARLAKLNVDTSDFDDSSRLQVELALSKPDPPPPPPPLPPSPPREPLVGVAVGGVPPKDLLSPAPSSAGIEATLAVNGKVSVAAAAAVAVAAPASAEGAPLNALPVVSPVLGARERALKALQAERLIAAEAAKARAAQAKGKTKATAKIGPAAVVAVEPPAVAAGVTAQSKSARSASTLAKTAAGGASTKTGASSGRVSPGGATPKSPRKDSGVPEKAKAVAESRGGNGHGNAGAGSGGGNGGEQAETRSKPVSKAPHPQAAVAETSKANAKASAAFTTPTVETAATAAVAGIDAVVVGAKGSRVVGLPPARGVSRVPPARGVSPVPPARGVSPVPRERRTPSPVPRPLAASSTAANDVRGAASFAAFGVPKAAPEPRNLSPSRRGNHSPTRPGGHVYAKPTPMRGSSGVGGGDLGGGVLAETALPPLKAAGKRLVIVTPSGPPDPTVRPWPYFFRGDYFALLPQDPRTGGLQMCDPSKNASYVGVIPPMEAVLAGLREENEPLQQLELEDVAEEAAAVTGSSGAESPPFAAADSLPSVTTESTTSVSPGDHLSPAVASSVAAIAPAAAAASVVGRQGAVSASVGELSGGSEADMIGPGGSANLEAPATAAVDAEAAAAAAAAAATPAEETLDNAAPSAGVVAKVTASVPVADAFAANASVARELVARQLVAGEPPTSAAPSFTAAAAVPASQAHGVRDLLLAGTAFGGEGRPPPRLDAAEGFPHELAVSGTKGGARGGVRDARIREVENELKTLQEIKIPRFVIRRISDVGVGIVFVVHWCWVLVFSLLVLSLLVLMLVLVLV